MTQNIYDNDAFFAAYSDLQRSRLGLAGAPEWPALRAMLPGLNGKRVLDLGCGFGWFCRFARENGAQAIEGIDVSENMLRRARDLTSDPAISYRRADLEDVQLPTGAFDIAYSSLVFHYVESLHSLLTRIGDALVPGGDLVFSTEHPIYTAPSMPEFREETGRTVWVVDRYLDEGPRSTNWLADGVIKRHRTIGSLLNMLVSAGFSLRSLEEWGPTQEQIANNPELARDRERPMFLLIAATRRVGE